jgi:hypothetical protein
MIDRRIEVFLANLRYPRWISRLIEIYAPIEFAIVDAIHRLLGKETR